MLCVYYCCYLLKNNNKSKRISNSILFSIELAQLELHFILNCFVYLCHCLFIVYFPSSTTMILLQMKHHLSRFSSCSLFGRCFSFSHLLILIINDTIFFPNHTILIVILSHCIFSRIFISFYFHSLESGHYFALSLSLFNSIFRSLSFLCINNHHQLRTSTWFFSAT